MKQGQERKIKEKLQKERALIALSASSLERVKKGLDKSPPAKKNQVRHGMMLETFDTKNIYILCNIERKNSYKVSIRISE